ncbi:hypothetical protein NON27_25450, partial [Vibrio parahaemolyticus]|nr:hypothetical protein [Vibrio parahaemolyticus]
LRADSKSQNNIQGTKQSTDQPKVNVQKKQLKKEQLKKVAEETKKAIWLLVLLRIVPLTATLLTKIKKDLHLKIQ